MERRPVRRRLTRTALAVALAAACAALAAPLAAASTPLRVSLITDSVGAALIWDPGPFQAFAAGLDVQGYPFGCRKLVVPGCENSAAVNPPSVLDVISQVGTGLGPIVVVDVGYNDFPGTYAAGLDEVMGRLLANGVQRVVWVTLEEGQDVWREIDDVIRAAPARWPQLAVADWGPVAQGEPWLTDAAHLNHDGAVALGAFLRPIVLAQVPLVVVPDTTAPALRLPAAVHALAADPRGRVLALRPVALDDVDGLVPEVCLPAPPHRFPLGRTTVTCTATDRAGNRATGSFEVYVTRKPAR